MWRSLWPILTALETVLAQRQDSHDPKGMEHFVTRPELSAPRYMVAIHRPEAVTPGYWLVTPYSNLDAQPPTNRNEWIPCETGAHIYDGNGTLIWSGACKYDNRNVFASEPFEFYGEQHIALWLDSQPLPGKNSGERPEADVLINSRYEEVSRVERPENGLLDGHEFKILPNGPAALTAMWKWEEVDASDIGQSSRLVQNYGFQEVDLNSGDVTFQWNVIEHVSLKESCDVIGMAKEPDKKDVWDWFHLNSVDKNDHGDYLVSSRNTNALYKISKDDGHIIWRLGGCSDDSDFAMDEGVVFHWQHHARFRSENETHTIISVFDNGSEQPELNIDIVDGPSSGKIIILDHASDPPTAKLLRRFNRPDGGSSSFLGSVQTIGDQIETANVFINWAFQGYISEHDAEDNVVLEAKFETERMRSYRAFKTQWVGRPTEPPVLKVLPIGYTGATEDIASALYVSWNGATEVARWAFYGSENEDGPFRLLTRVEKGGFETSWVTPGRVDYAYAEALDMSGNPLGKSDIAATMSKPEGNYKVWNALLENAKSGGGSKGEPFDPSSEGLTHKYGNFDLSKGSTGTADDFDTVGPTTPVPPQHSRDALFEGALYQLISGLLICAFAVYGFHHFVRNLVQRFTRRRKGYMTLSNLP